MSAFSKLLKEGKLPVALAQHHDVSNDDKVVTAWDFYWTLRAFKRTIGVSLVFSLAMVVVGAYMNVRLPFQDLSNKQHSSVVEFLFMIFTVVPLLALIINRILGGDYYRFRWFERHVVKLVKELGSIALLQPTRPFALMTFEEQCTHARAVLVQLAYQVESNPLNKDEDGLLDDRNEQKALFDDFCFFEFFGQNENTEIYTDARKRLAAEKTKTETSSRDLISFDDARGVLSMSHSELEREITEDRLHPYIKSGGVRYFLRDEVVKLAQKMQPLVESSRVCCKCQGDHRTDDCPQAENASTGPALGGASP